MLRPVHLQRRISSLTQRAMLIRSLITMARRALRHVPSELTPGAAGKDAGVRRPIDVASAEHQPHPLIAHLIALFEQGSQRCSAGALGHVVGIGKIIAHCPFNLVVRHRNYSFNKAIDDFDGCRVRDANGEAVGDCGRRFGGHGLRAAKDSA
jgi:hypothetical protein